MCGWHDRLGLFSLKPMCSLDRAPILWRTKLPILAKLGAGAQIGWLQLVLLAHFA